MQRFILSIFALAAASAGMVWAQTPSIEFTSIPPFGTSGLNTYVSGLAQTTDRTTTAVAVFLYFPGQGWYTEPGCAAPLSPVSYPNTWSARVGNSALDPVATKFAAYLVPTSVGRPCVFGAAAIPASITSVALASTIVDRPNPAPTTLSFSGLTWTVKTSGALSASPGPNRFSADPSLVYVDAQGRLHLKIAPCPDQPAQWCSTEVYTSDSVGFGQYTFQLASSVGDLDPNEVLGMFTWSDTADFNNRELDFEFSRWGDAANIKNAQYVVQPYTTPGNLHRFQMPASSTSTHTLTWSDTAVQFLSQASGTTVDQFSYTQASGIPPRGDAKLHLNFYLNQGAPPTDGQPREIIFNSVTYTPSGPTVGAVLATPVTTYASTTATATVTASDSSCHWTASSNVPWLAVSAPASGTGSGVFNYYLADNIGPQRIGSITFASSNCNLTIGQQQLFVTQTSINCQLGLTLSNPVPAAGGSLDAEVTASPAACPWYLSIQAGTWTYISQSYLGTGSGSSTLQAQPNYNPNSRSLTVVLNNSSGTGPNVTATLTQAGTAGCAYSLTPSAATVLPKGGGGAITVTASTGCPWQATSNAGWLYVNSASTGVGNGAVTFAVGVNPTGVSRTGVVTIAGQTFTVTQPADPVNAMPLVDKIGIFRASGFDYTLWVRDRNGDGQFTSTADTASPAGALGLATDLPIIGDWTGSGSKKLGVYRPSTSSIPAAGAGLFLLDSNGDEVFDSGDQALYLSPAPGDVPVVGRWNGGAKDLNGVFRRGVWYLDVNGDGTFSKVIALGQAGDVPVVGDWNGSGSTKVGVFRNGLWILDYNGNGQWDGPAVDRFFYLGQAGDTPVVGDWNASGSSKAGIFRGGLWVLDYNGNGQWDGLGVDEALFNGNSTTKPLVGDWTGDGRSKAGTFSYGTWFLDVLGDGSFSRLAFLGQVGDVPIVGRW